MAKQIIELKRCLCRGTLSQKIAHTMTEDHYNAVVCGYQDKNAEYQHKENCTEEIYLYYNAEV